jgi:hypothetical protein
MYKFNKFKDQQSRDACKSFEILIKNSSKREFIPLILFRF